MIILKQYLLFLVLFPLIGFIINGLGYKRLPKYLINTIACTSVLISFVLSLLAFWQLIVLKKTSVQIDYFPFLSIKNLNVNFAFIFDRLNSIYILIITGIGFLIHLYSVGYMSEDKAIGKYFAYLNLFIFSMLILVLGANYLILFIGWEGVGFCSFLLIGFWNHNKEYTYAARKAFILNRIGDLCFLIAMFILIINYNSLDFAIIKTQILNSKTNITIIITITMLMFVGATGKSAQLPLLTWLPDAMAGPTPVSALIHAATMVTAGIYLISRSCFLFDLLPITISEIIAFVGLATAFIAATIACVQKDIKKVLAYSTISQLGFMFLSLGMKNYEGAIFHVITHAFFKALLFLGAGSIIHSMHGEQDMTKMGGLKKSMPITQITFLIACLAISGIPGLSGFFSKDNILMSVFPHNPMLYYAGVLVAVLTAFYIFRAYFLVFHGSFRGTAEQEKHLHESPISMTLPLVVLAIFSVVAGYINLPHIFSGNSRLAQYIGSVVTITPIHLAIKQELILMSITVGIVILIILYTYKTYTKKQLFHEQSQNPIYMFFYNKWYIDELYNTIIVKPILAISECCKSTLESKVIDGLVNKTGGCVFFFSNKIRYLQDGKIGIYAFWTFIGIILLFICLFV